MAKKAKAFKPLETVVAETAAAYRKPFDADGQKLEGEIFYEDINSTLNHEYGRGHPPEVYDALCQGLREKGFRLVEKLEKLPEPAIGDPWGDLYDDPKARDDPEFSAEMIDIWKEDFMRYHQGMKPKEVLDADQMKSYRLWLKRQKILQDTKIVPPPGGSYATN